LSNRAKFALHTLLAACFTQAALGIGTLIYEVPISIASIHQNGALMAQALGINEDKKSEKSTRSFKKGHRRAQSMPSHYIGKQSQRYTRNQENDKTQVSDKNGDKTHRHVQLPASNQRSGCQNPPDFDAIEVMEDDKDFEVPINEEEMMQFEGIEHSEGEEGNTDVHKRHKRFWQVNWKGVHFTGLPAWLQGCVAFTGAFVWLLSRPTNVMAWPDKLIFSAFFVGAILCSFVPWIYYAFYCRAFAMSFYIGMIVVLGIAAVVVSLWDKFAQPKFRPLRGGVFLAMGLSSIVPALHLALTDGFKWMFDYASFHWLLLMGFLYITGAAVYMVRFPERCCPGKCDIMCHSHQLFHIFVILAAAVHYHGILEVAMKRLEGGSCSEQLIEQSGTDKADIQWIDEQLRPY
uniref:Adiponectin receptor n=1 Tax=Meloidogyne javanica TaxID=6303 RepID=A0A915LKS7_MELJA